MSGVLKVVSSIASVVAMVPGPWQLPAALVAVGAGIGASALAKRPKTPQVSRESIDRLNASIDPRTPRKMVFGQTAMATDIRDQEYTDNQTYLHRFIVVAAHKVQAIDEIWFDDKLAWTVGGGAQGEYAGYLTVTPILEGSAGNAINISSRMGSTRRFTGLAYVHLRYKLTGNSKKTDSPFAQGIATRMTIRGKGAFVYDPRKDSTVPGGSGSHRANDQSTWTWDANASRNPALQKLWYLLGWRINGKLSVGRGIPPSRIDLESYAIAANLCDEAVALAAGGTEPRYRSDGVFSEGDSPTTVLDNFKAAMNADLDDVGGKLRVTVFHNDLADPVAAFGDDDMIEPFKWTQTPSLVDSFNLVRGSYTDASDKSLYQMVDYPQVELASPDGIERPDSFDLALVQSPSQAQRLAKQRLQRQQYGGEFQTVWGARGWLVQKNSIVTQSCSALGWVNKLFRVADMEHRVDGTCPVVLREENAEIYAWDADESPAVSPADPTEYDYTLSPFYLGLDGTGKLFVQTIAPNAAESTGGDIWQDDNGRYWIRREDIALTCNGVPLTCGGMPLTIVWTPTASQPVRSIAEAAAAARQVADAATASASAANAALADIASDGLLTPGEKPDVILNVQTITSEQAGIDAQATAYGITTEKTAYDSAVSALTTYLATLTAPVAWNNLTANTTIDGPTFRAKFADVYDKRQILLNKIAEKAGTTAVWGGVGGTGKPEDNADVTSQITGQAEINISANSAGTPTVPLPVTAPFTLIRNGTDVTATATWSVTVLSGTIAASFPSPGSLSLNSSGGVLSSATLRLTAVYGSTTRNMDVRVTRNDAAPPSGGGSGGGGSSSFSATSSSTSPTALSPELSLTVGASGNVDLTAGYSFSVSGSVVNARLFTQWYEWNGSAYVAISGTAKESDDGYSTFIGEPASGTNSRQITGLTPSAAKKYRLYGYNSGGSTGSARYVNGTVGAASS